MARTKKQKPFLDATTIGLEEWLSMIFTYEEDRKFSLVDFRFPTDAHASEYLASVALRPDFEVKHLIRSFLIPPGVQGHDHQFFHHWLENGDIIQLMDTNEYARRLFRNEGWEGMTWILDLLPDWPQQALNALDAFIRAHALYLSDNRVWGLCDALSIIRHKYLLSFSPRDILNDISPRDFEFLIAALFRKQKYHTKITQRSRDGGADIICSSTNTLIKQKVLIECKHHTGTIGVEVVRKLEGVVSNTGATSGWVVTSSKFSAPAAEFASTTGRIQLLDYKELNLKFNEYFGARWSERLPSLISEEQRIQIKQTPLK